MPKAVEGDARGSRHGDGRLPDAATEQAAASGPPRGAVKTNASGSGPTKSARCSSSRRITDRAQQLQGS